MVKRKKINTENEGEIFLQGLQNLPPEQNKSPEKQSLKKKKDKEKSSSWKHRLTNILKYIVVFLAVPPFLNFAALIQEEKVLKPEGYFLIPRLYNRMKYIVKMFKIFILFTIKVIFKLF